MWSCTEMPSGAAMSMIALVIWMSACDGEGSPEGWLCTRIIVRFCPLNFHFKWPPSAYVGLGGCTRRKTDGGKNDQRPHCCYPLHLQPDGFEIEQSRSSAGLSRTAVSLSIWR